MLDQVHRKRAPYQYDVPSASQPLDGRFSDHSFNREALWKGMPVAISSGQAKGFKGEVRSAIVKFLPLQPLEANPITAAHQCSQAYSGFSASTQTSSGYQLEKQKQTQEMENTSVKPNMIRLQVRLAAHAATNDFSILHLRPDEWVLVEIYSRHLCWCSTAIFSHWISGVGHVV